VDIWIHGQHLLADGVKMAKSTGNSFILSDLEAQGFDPLAFRYLCLTTRYKTRLNFTFTALKAAQRGLLRLQNRVWQWSLMPHKPADGAVIEEWCSRLLETVNDDLDMPTALALTWDMVRSDMPYQDKLGVIREFDHVLGLDLAGAGERFRVEKGVSDRIRERARLRSAGKYAEADAIRAELDEKGYVVRDTPGGTIARPKTAWERRQEEWVTYSAASEVESLIDHPDAADFTIGFVASNYLSDVQRLVDSALKWAGDRRVEVVALDSGCTDGTGEWLERASAADPRIRVIHADHALGEGAAKNVVLKQSLGNIVMLFDTSVEVTGDIFAPIGNALSDESVGVFGPFGLRTDNLHHFHDGEGETGDMDAMQAYLFAFKRQRLKDVGLTRESFRFYRNLDLDYSFHFKEKGYRIVADSSMPVVLHQHRAWENLAEAERDEFSRKNYRRFLEKWGDRADLLAVNRTGGSAHDSHGHDHHDHSDHGHKH